MMPAIVAIDIAVLGLCWSYSALGGARRTPRALPSQMTVTEIDRLHFAEMNVCWLALISWSDSGRTASIPVRYGSPASLNTPGTPGQGARPLGYLPVSFKRECCMHSRNHSKLRCGYELSMNAFEGVEESEGQKGQCRARSAAV
jgi:hypothetical protein